MIVPLIAGCLVLAMVAGMALTMFSANRYLRGFDNQRTGGADTRQTGQGLRSGTSSAPSANNKSAGPSSRAVAHLPPGTISVAGKPVKLRDLAAMALAIVPANCACAAVITQLLSQARSASVPVYLIGRRGVSQAELKSLVPDSAKGKAVVALDAKDALKSIPEPGGATIVLVDAHGGMTVEPRSSSPLQLKLALQKLGQVH